MRGEFVRGKVVQWHAIIANMSDQLPRGQLPTPTPTLVQGRKTVHRLQPQA